MRAAAESLVSVDVTPPVEYANGDRSQYLDLVFRLRWESGDPTPARRREHRGRLVRAGRDAADVGPSMRDRVQAAVDNPARARFTSDSAGRTG